MGYVYVPIVKGHENDLRALSLLRKAWAHTKPLVEYTLPKLGTQADTDLMAFIDRIRRYIALNETFVDFYGFHPGTPNINGKHPIAAAFEIVRAHDLPVTPVVGLDREVEAHRHEQMWKDLAVLFARMHRGVCFRVDVDDIEGAPEETWEQIVERTAQLRLASSQVDVVMDLRSLRERREDSLKDRIIDFAMSSRAFVPRSLILAGSSALHTVADVPEKGTLAVERRELRLWAELFVDAAFRAPFIFGDYGVVYPDFDRDTAATHINAKIRYTAENKIHYFRGQLYAKVPAQEQYHSLAQRLVASTCYEGQDASYGDRYVLDCARGRRKPRSPGPWVLADQNRHFEHTARQTTRLVSSLRDIELADIPSVLSGETQP